MARITRRTLIKRGLLLLVTGVSLYLLAPSLIEVFSAWDSLASVSPMWLGIMAIFEAASFVSLWELQRIAVGTSSWFAVATSQLAGNAVGRLVPGGAAAAGALQYRLLVQAGVEPARVASGLTAVAVLTFGVVLAMPVLAVPAILGGLRVDPGLSRGAYLGAGTFVLMAVTGMVFVKSDRAVEATGRAVQWVLNRIRRKRPPIEDLPERLLAQRDALVATFGRQWRRTAFATVGKSAFDYMALVAAIEAVGGDANPALVLFAYATAAVLAMIPVTPGGLGFVEAGLTGTLVLAGVNAGDAVVATLAYRLVSFWMPLPFGLAGYLLARRRYGAGTGSPPAVETPSSLQA